MKGFARLTPEQRSEIARLGGKATAAKTNMAELGRKGGQMSGASKRRAAAVKDEKVGVKPEVN